MGLLDLDVLDAHLDPFGSVVDMAARMSLLCSFSAQNLLKTSMVYALGPNFIASKALVYLLRPVLSSLLFLVSPLNHTGLSLF